MFHSQTGEKFILFLKILLSLPLKKVLNVMEHFSGFSLFKILIFIKLDYEL